jgi:hypothetical protein
MRNSEGQADHRGTGGAAVRGLIVLNSLLLVLLGAVTFGSRADAQATRVRGEFTMIDGGANGSDADVVYVVDVVNQEMIAVTYDQSKSIIDGVGYRNLATDATEMARGRASRN